MLWCKIYRQVNTNLNLIDQTIISFFLSIFVFFVLSYAGELMNFICWPCIK